QRRGLRACNPARPSPARPRSATLPRPIASPIVHIGLARRTAVTHQGNRARRRCVVQTLLFVPGRTALPLVGTVRSHVLDIRMDSIAQADAAWTGAAVRVLGGRI